MSKTIGWVVSMSFLICGLCFAQMMTDTGDIEPMAVVIFCFGVVFWLSKTTYETSKKVMTASVGMLVLTGLLAKFVLVQFLSDRTGLGFYSLWDICLIVLGGPVMGYVFKNNKD